MDDTFKNLVKEIFEEQAFTEDVYINGFKTKCIQSAISNNIIYTEAGMSDGVNFTLDVELDVLDRIPAEGDKVLYRDKTYKIASTEVDSANASMKLYLISMSKGA